MKTKIYFQIGNFKVVDFNDKSFANFEVIPGNRCFYEIEEAILYTIGCNYGKRNDIQIQFMVDTFITMAKK
jgi:hypothetical protein